MKLNLELNVWSIGTTIAAITMAFVTLQGDIKALQAEDTRTTDRIKMLETRTDMSRDAIARMEGDIRVIRQILEGQSPPRPR